MKKTIVLTGGGTAGHVTPHLALLDRLLEGGWQVHYIGTENGIERGMMEKRPEAQYHAIASGKLRRYFSLQNLTDPFRVIRGFFQSLGLMKRLKPDIVFSKGGFVAVPVVAAAWFKRVPVLAHESDLTPGLANRVSAVFSRKVATTFPACAEALGKKGVHTGTPMRPELFRGNRGEGLKLAGLSGEKPVLLMMGGSQGAQAVNAALRGALPRLLKDFEVIHLCGKGKLDEALSGTPGYFQAEFVEGRLSDLLAASDFALSRAGATAISEFLALRIPLLLVPYPKGASRGDQILNARDFERRGLALVLPQGELTPDSLVEKLAELRAQGNRIREAMAAEPPADGSEKMLELIGEISGKGGKND